MLSRGGLSLSEALIKSHSYRGKRQDITGLINLGARYYDSLSTRFISPDPYGHAGSIDLYSYANDNPIRYCDPDGRFASAVLEKARGLYKEHQAGIKKGHTAGRNVLAKSVHGFDNPRSLLARDIQELRRAYPDIPNARLQQLLNINKSMYPEIRK